MVPPVVLLCFTFVALRCWRLVDDCCCSSFSLLMFAHGCKS